MVLLQLPLKRWEFYVMRASKGEARRERHGKKEKERAAVASAVTAVTAVILLYVGNKCAPLTHASAIALAIWLSLSLPPPFSLSAALALSFFPSCCFSFFLTPDLSSLLLFAYTLPPVSGSLRLS